MKKSTVKKKRKNVPENRSRVLAVDFDFFNPAAQAVRIAGKLNT
jgi:hypothetical protein